jgi:hypothetical protein
MDNRKKRKCNRLLEELGDRPSLELNVNKYTVDELVEFINALKENSSLKDLTVFRDFYELPSVVSTIADLLRVNTAITSLNIKCMNIGIRGAVSISESLKVNSSLTHLSLSHWCNAHAIADVLKENTRLTSINLANNNIKVKGAIAIADALKENTSLTSIDLRGNDIRDDGAVAIADALKEKK